MGRYFKNIWEAIWTVLVGMKITFMHMFTPAVTIQYPDVRLKLPERARNRLYVNMDDCIGCDQCSMACPVDCIKIETLKSTPDVDLGVTSVGSKKRLYVTRFDIDIAKCCYCGLCVPPCPTECIKMTDVYEFSEYERTNLIYKFSTMRSAEIDAAKSKLAAYDKEQAEKKAAAPKPAAPAAASAARVPAGAKPVGVPAGAKPVGVPAGAKPVGVPAGAKPVGVPAATPAQTGPASSPNDPPTNPESKA